MLPRRVVYYGSDEPAPAQSILRAGPLTLVYEIDPTFGGNLRYIRLGDRELVRRVYVAVRDHNWGTVPATVSNPRIDAGDDAFHITFDVTHQEDDVDFFWKSAITGDAQGCITFTMEGVARTTFLRNRIGFCLLHPMRQCAGQPCIVKHTDGTISHGAFPDTISPHQPFMDIRAVSHEAIPGVWLEARFAGDTFEMEDQRNWTDASFKTYSTPLALEMPVEVQAGTKIAQSIELTLKGEIPELRADTTAAPLVFTVGEVASAPTQVTGGRDARGPSVTQESSPLPRIGLGTAGHGQPLSAQELERLRALNLSHLRVDLDLTQPDYERVLHQATIEARALDVPLEVALFLSDNAARELQALSALLNLVKPPVCTWLIFHVEEDTTTESWIRMARQYLSSYEPAAYFGGGTNMYFTHLNRRRPPMQAADLMAYSLNPQVHAFDNESLVETLETQAVTVASARQFTGELPLAISPITLKPRAGGDADDPESETGREALPPQVDVRQMSLFGAGWTVGSLKYVLKSGVHSVTYYETTGWRGVMELAAGSPLPDVFRSLPGSVFPLYHVLADVGEFSDGQVVPTLSSHTLRLDGWAVRKDGKLRVVVANLTGDPQPVTVRNVEGQASVRYLDEKNVEAAMVDPDGFRNLPGEHERVGTDGLSLSLRPYAIARIDVDLG